MDYNREKDYVWYFHDLVEDILFSGGDDAKLAGLYEKHWPKVKEAIRRDYFSVTADGISVKPSPDSMFSLNSSEEMFFINDIYDISDALNNTKKYEERAAFAKDCLELFDFPEENGRPNLDLLNLSLDIGEAYSDAGKIEESEACYEKLMSDYPDNGYIIAGYVSTLKLRGEKEKAKELLEKYISPHMEPLPENEMLFERAKELYEEEGKPELVKIYDDLLNRIYEEESYMDIVDLDEEDPFDFGPFIENKTVVHTEKKIYPNDPCPCGSGKKYKKCCGKK